MKDEIKQQIEAEKQSDAVEFLKWIRENAEMALNSKWLYYQHPFRALNNEELYELFKQSKTK